MALMLNSIKYLEEVSNFSQTVSKTRGEKTYHSFYEGWIVLIPVPEKTLQERIGTKLPPVRAVVSKVLANQVQIAEKSGVLWSSGDHYNKNYLNI